MEYISFKFSLNPKEPFSDMLTYSLSETGFDMFEETEVGITAHVQSAVFNENEFNEAINLIRDSGCKIEFASERIPWQNWNEEWEKNFEPEIIANRIYIRADFHPRRPEFEYEILIQPKMSFGTGHHPTTSQVMKMMLKEEFHGKKVLDIGSGTGILGILAYQLGAEHVTAVDHDPQCTVNCRENAVANGCPQMEIQTGTMQTVSGKYDIILANINRNIILADLPLYSAVMKPQAKLICSGFYSEDLEMIQEKASQYNLKLNRQISDQNWCCAIFNKLTG